MKKEISGHESVEAPRLPSTRITKLACCGIYLVRAKLGSMESITSGGGTLLLLQQQLTKTDHTSLTTCAHRITRWCQLPTVLLYSGVRDFPSRFSTTIDEVCLKKLNEMVASTQKLKTDCPNQRINRQTRHVEPVSTW